MSGAAHAGDPSIVVAAQPVAPAAKLGTSRCARRPCGIVDELRAEVAREISPIAKPREVHVVPELPKTRSGKIMRRLLRDVAENRELGDTSTLLDPSVFDAIKAGK